MLAVLLFSCFSFMFYFFCSLRFFVTILHIFLFNNEATIGKRQLVRGVQEEEVGGGNGGSRLECVCKREGKIQRCVCVQA